MSLDVCLALIVVVYAFILGVKPVGVDDMYFPLNTARWIIERHEIPWVDTFSYTAYGAPWIYPVGGGLMFYAIYSVGGYVALSLTGGAACAASVALTLRRGSGVSIALAALLSPVIAIRCVVRADLCSTVCAAAFLCVLWNYFETGRARLWILPVLTALWANLHLGFVFAYFLIAAYIGVEVLEMPWAARRRLALARLRRAWPWLLGCLPAPLLNPYGPWIFKGFYENLSAPQDRFIGEWLPLALNWQAVHTAFLAPPNIMSTVYVGLALAMVLGIVALWQAQLGAAAMLFGAAALTIHVNRFAATAALITVIVGPYLWRAKARVPAAAALAFAGVWLAVQISTDPRAKYPCGLSYQVPDRALDFVARENLPGNLLMPQWGAFQVWKLPQFKQYDDARTVPFGPAHFGRRMLILNHPDLWAEEADKYSVNTVIGLQTHAHGDLDLLSFCYNPKWIPVYLDEISGVFVRASPEYERLRIDCATAPLPVGDRRNFQTWDYAALTLVRLGRVAEARTAINQAVSLMPLNAEAHLTRADLATNLAAAEQDYHLALKLMPYDASSWMGMERLFRLTNQPQEALDAIDRAMALYGGAPEPMRRRRQQLLKALGR